MLKVSLGRLVRNVQSAQLQSTCKKNVTGRTISNVASALPQSLRSLPTPFSRLHSRMRTNALADANGSYCVDCLLVCSSLFVDVSELHAQSYLFDMSEFVACSQVIVCHVRIYHFTGSVCFGRHPADTVGSCSGSVTKATISRTARNCAAHAHSASLVGMRRFPATRYKTVCVYSVRTRCCLKILRCIVFLHTARALERSFPVMVVCIVECKRLFLHIWLTVSFNTVFGRV